MFLKSLTLRGFKSFADKTELLFEPGITVVVGPNGSGKSNIVDALSWSLGTSSPKSLRGGQMADVIFAGAPGKPALGRASVEITIDNSAATLPIEFAEVTVSRAMFASGENDYAINAVACRALDIQELLSDTGLGREHHTIVGQGQLDAVLNARPEERRALIEEAAGILKHRRRKERALRKLTQMEGHLERLQDLLRELRRNLRPLERQAEIAAKHARLQLQLKDVRVARATRELARLHQAWTAFDEAKSRSDAAMAELDARLAAATTADAEVERALGELTPAVREASETHYALGNLAERYRGLVARIEERRSGLVEAVEEPVAGRDPAELRTQARAEEAVLEQLQAERDVAAAALAAAETARRTAEQARRAHEQAAAAESRRRTEARERLLRWEGEVAALRSALAQAASEEGRLASQRAGLAARRAELEHDIDAVQHEIQRLDADSQSLAAHLAAAEATAAKRGAAQDAAALKERELERRRASLEARADALRAASAEATEGASALLAAAEAGELGVDDIVDVVDIVGPLADHLAVVEGLARAVAAALGPLGDALVVRSRSAAAAAVGFTRARGSGRVLLLAMHDSDVPGPPADPMAQELRDVGARPLLAGLRGDSGVLAALAPVLDGVYVVDDYTVACSLAVRHPDRIFISTDGDVAGPRGYAGGSAQHQSAVLTRAAAEQAEAQLEHVADELLRAHRQLADADRDLTAARHELDAAAAAMQESDGLITSAAERMNRNRKELATCAREQEVLDGQTADLAREIAGRQERLSAMESRGVETVQALPDGPDLEAEQLDDLLAEAREHEVQSRLSVSAVEQRGSELARRVTALRREADEVERQLAERERRRLARLAAIDRCVALAAYAQEGLARAEASLVLAASERDRLEEARAAQQRELGVVRAQLRELADEQTALREVRHREDLQRSELRHALDAVSDRLRSHLGVEPEQALQSDEALAVLESLENPAPRDDVLAEEEEKLVRKVGLLGAVNPLALEEFTAMEERHRFLGEQLEDLKASKRDLMQVVEAVDERIKDVFGDAFADVAAQFEQIFPRMFPGGEGRLVLTDPDDLLETGVEVEARPPGKRVKRLSLLSGGERSLTALAVLFAIFAARPSPFYVLDEVEAALDDVNLQRFLEVVTDFRATSQLIIVTHQRRTMEIADCLYGVSMQGNGVSKVISQRMAEAVTRH